MKSITLTATDANYNESIPGFLHQHPIPMRPNLDSTRKNPLPDIPQYTTAQWVKKQLEDWYYRESRHGLEKIASETVTLDRVFE